MCYKCEVPLHTKRVQCDHGTDGRKFFSDEDSPAENGRVAEHSLRIETRAWNWTTAQGDKIASQSISPFSTIQNYTKNHDNRNDL